jgi:hypothetical protein
MAEYVPICSSDGGKPAKLCVPRADRYVTKIVKKSSDDARPWLRSWPSTNSDVWSLALVRNDSRSYDVLVD